MSSLQLIKVLADNFLTSHLGCIRFVKEWAWVAGSGFGGSPGVQRVQVLPVWGSELSHLLWGVSVSRSLHPFLALFIITQQQTQPRSSRHPSHVHKGRQLMRGRNDRKGEEPLQKQR